MQKLSKHSQFWTFKYLETHIHSSNKRSYFSSVYNFCLLYNHIEVEGTHLQQTCIILLNLASTENKCVIEFERVCR